MAFDTDPGRILTAEELFAAQDIDEADVFIPEWGASVRVRALTLHQVAQITKQATKRLPNGTEETDREQQSALMIVAAMVAPKLTVADLPKLKLKSAKAITRIVNAVANFGATEEGLEEADKSLSDGPESGIRVFPGGSARNDGSAVAAGNDDG